ncbi:MAG: threonine synthase [Archaeoglobi archaeon]|nr:threonine synthase [Archaeoglobi archaeon]
MGEKIWRCHCGAHLNLIFDAEMRIEELESRDKSIWRYFEVLPVERASSITTFNEGFTPLLRAELFNREVLLKMEYLFPTGSFKDRGSSVMISVLRELGIREIVEDSSGNAGASISAYSARAKIKCHIFVPESAPETKLSQIEFYGAEIHRIKGSREEVAERARNFAESRTGELQMPSSSRLVTELFSSAHISVSESSEIWGSSKRFLG